MKKIVYFLVFCIVTAQGQTTEKSLFWQITRKGHTAPSYLYGTMHVQDQRVFNFSSGVTDALKSSDIYVMELNMDSVNQLELMSMMMMKDDLSLKDLMRKKKFKFVDTYFKDSLGQALFLYQKMLPIITMQMISLKNLSQDQEEALDLYFSTLAKENNIPLLGLEKMEDQINALSSIPYKAQADMLYQAAKDAYKTSVDSSDVDKMIESYLSGDLETLADMGAQFEKKDKKTQEIFMKTMLLDRNITMANGIEEIIKNKKAFIAIGAAHLGGENGVIQLLRNKGFTVMAIH